MLTSPHWPKLVLAATGRFRQALGADYILYYKANIPLAVIEAKDNTHSVGDGSGKTPRYYQVNPINAAIADKREELAELCRRYDVARLEVFGSAARGTNFDPETSDADFLVEFDPNSDLPRVLQHDP